MKGAQGGTVYVVGSIHLARAGAGPRTWFVVVGAGHGVGPRGLLVLLQEQGHMVRQLPKEG